MIFPTSSGGACVPQCTFRVSPSRASASATPRNAPPSAAVFFSAPRFPKIKSGRSVGKYAATSIGSTRAAAAANRSAANAKASSRIAACPAAASTAARTSTLPGSGLSAVAVPTPSSLAARASATAARSFETGDGLPRAAASIPRSSASTAIARRTSTDAPRTTTTVGAAASNGSGGEKTRDPRPRPLLFFFPSEDRDEEVTRRADARGTPRGAPATSVGRNGRRVRKRSSPPGRARSSRPGRASDGGGVRRCEGRRRRSGRESFAPRRGRAPPVSFSRTSRSNRSPLADASHAQASPAASAATIQGPAAASETSAAASSFPSSFPSSSEPSPPPAPSRVARTTSSSIPPRARGRVPWVPSSSSSSARVPLTSRPIAAPRCALAAKKARRATAALIRESSSSTEDGSRCIGFARESSARTNAGGGAGSRRVLFFLGAFRSGPSNMAS